MKTGMMMTVLMTVLMMVVCFPNGSFAWSDDDTYDILLYDAGCQLDDDCANSGFGILLSIIAFFAVMASFYFNSILLLKNNL